MHDAMYDRGPRDAFTAQSIKDAAKKAGLDMAQYEKCLTSSKDEASKKIDADMELAQKVGVGGTPSLFINGEKFEKGANEIADAIDSILTSGSKTN